MDVFMNIIISDLTLSISNPIPTYSRIGNGYVYSSKHFSAYRVAKAIMKILKGYSSGLRKNLHYSLKSHHI